MDKNCDTCDKIKEEALKKLRDCAQGYINERKHIGCPFRDDYCNPFLDILDLESQEREEVRTIITDCYDRKLFFYFCCNNSVAIKMPCPDGCKGKKLDAECLYDEKVLNIKKKHV